MKNLVAKIAKILFALILIGMTIALSVKLSLAYLYRHQVSQAFDFIGLVKQPDEIKIEASIDSGSRFIREVKGNPNFLEQLASSEYFDLDNFEAGRIVRDNDLLVVIIQNKKDKAYYLQFEFKRDGNTNSWVLAQCYYSFMWDSGDGGIR